MSVPQPTLYQGHVMHMRLIPRAHRFRYGVFSLLVDIDRLDEMPLVRNRFGLMSFHDRDHGARDGSPLRPWVDRELSEAGLPGAASVMLLAFPRILGYVFNPLSVYFCYDNENRLFATLYEVKNTFGGQTVYTHATTQRGGAIRQTQHKEMYVSPFVEMDQTYQFTIQPPSDRFALRIRQSGKAGETLIATHTAKGEPLTRSALRRAFLRHPLMSFRVIALIHWQALRLFLKGVPFDPDGRSVDETQKTA